MKGLEFYFEYSLSDLKSNLDEILEKIIHPSVIAEMTNIDECVRFRVINIPIGEMTRKARLEEIKANGSDRTDPNYPAFKQYKAAAEEYGVDILDVFDCGKKVNLFHNLKIKGANAILIYDACTENGIHAPNGIEYTFKNPKEKTRALLAIIGVK